MNTETTTTSTQNDNWSVHCTYWDEPINLKFLPDTNEEFLTNMQWFECVEGYDLETAYRLSLQGYANKYGWKAAKNLEFCFTCEAAYNAQFGTATFTGREH